VADPEGEALTMSRSNYTDDYGDDFPGQLALYRANVKRSMRSRAGQARLRELRDALLALPVKALEYETFVDPFATEPHVCALGAWALAKTGNAIEAAKLVGEGADDDVTAEALGPLGWPHLVVRDIIYLNDEASYNVETPAQRYTRMLGWVSSQIVETPNAS
jgi:hypothetical protein